MSCLDFIFPSGNSRERADAALEYLPARTGLAPTDARKAA